MSDLPLLLLPDEAADLLRVTEAELRQLTLDGDVPAVRVGHLFRYQPDLLDEWIGPPKPRVRQPKADPAYLTNPVYGTIYMVGPARGPVKIGFTRGHVERRVQEIQTGCWLKLHCIDSFRGSLADEKRLHGQLKRHRRYGEWFSRKPAVRRFTCVKQKMGDKN